MHLEPYMRHKWSSRWSKLLFELFREIF